MSYGQKFRSKYSATCADCLDAIKPAQEVHYRYPEKVLCHVDCQAAKNQAEAAEKAAPYKIGGGSGYGCHGWTVGQIVRATASQREKQYPEWLYVVRAVKHYYAEDGLSFGVGDESGFTYSAACREATAEESALARADYERGLKKTEARKRLEEIIKQVEAGECPAGPVVPEGDRVFDSQNIYGGGSWFVVGPEWVWYCQNNGADGDNWAANNVRTGGAGAIGHRIPATGGLLAEIESLKTILE